MAYQGLARRLKFLTQSLRRHGPGHVVEVFRQAAVRRRYARAPISEPTRERLVAAYGATDAAACLAAVARGAAQRLPLTRAQRKEFLVGVLERSQGYDAILEEAERFAEGRFVALGICTVERDGAYDWHRDYGSGVKWDRLPFDRVRFIVGDGADVKFPWELSRCYWIAWLGKAYWISGNGAWSRDFVRHIDSWRQANPVNVGVNWAMPMEVAIRSFWLAMGFGLFHGAPNIADEWWIDYLRLAWAHGSYLEHNLEYFSNLTNHYISNCFGLVACGALFADTADGRRWLAEGRRRLQGEIAHQVLPDGTHYERSLPYHRLVVEMYLIAMTVLERCGRPFGERTTQAIERMSEVLCAVIGPDGTVPQIGDADDGLILRTTQSRDVYDARDVAAIAAVTFGRADFARAAGTFAQGAIMMLGAAGFEAFESLRGIAGVTGSAGVPGAGGAIGEPRAHGERTVAGAIGGLSHRVAHAQLFGDGGFASMRSSSLHVVADVGVIGLHGNNDTLSFTLSDTVGSLIVDPGTYCYTRSTRLRNELRSTRAHNAPSIDRREIATFDGLWRIKREIPAPEILSWTAEGAAMGLVARHRAYDKIAIVRDWRLTGAELVVCDEIETSATHVVSVRFTLHHDIIVEQLDERTVRLSRSAGEIASFSCSHVITPIRGWYSPGYGVAAATTILTLETTLSGPARIQYICRLSTSEPR